MTAARARTRIAERVAKKRVRSSGRQRILAEGSVGGRGVSARTQGSSRQVVTISEISVEARLAGAGLAEVRGRRDWQDTGLKAKGWLVRGYRQAGLPAAFAAITRRGPIRRGLRGR